MRHTWEVPAVPYTAPTLVTSAKVRVAMTDVYPVDATFAAKARIDKATYQRLYRESLEDPDAFWGKAAERLDWYVKPTKVKDVSYQLDDFRIKWFEDGVLNVSVNCLDRQLATRGDKTALLFEPD